MFNKLFNIFQPSKNNIFHSLIKYQKLSPLNIIKNNKLRCYFRHFQNIKKKEKNIKTFKINNTKGIIIIKGILEMEKIQINFDFQQKISKENFDLIFFEGFDFYTKKINEENFEKIFKEKSKESLITDFKIFLQNKNKSKNFLQNFQNENLKKMDLKKKYKSLYVYIYDISIIFSENIILILKQNFENVNFIFIHPLFSNNINYFNNYFRKVALFFVKKKFLHFLENCEKENLEKNCYNFEKFLSTNSLEISNFENIKNIIENEKSVFLMSKKNLIYKDFNFYDKEEMKKFKKESNILFYNTYDYSALLDLKIEQNPLFNILFDENN